MLFRNTLAQSSSVFVAYLASLILAPVMLSRLGLEAFGIWAVTGAFVTYARTLDLGVGRSLIRFVALYDAAGDRRGVRECLSLGLIAVTLLSLVGIVASILLAPLVADVLDVSSGSEMRVILVSSVVTGMTYAYAQVLTAVPIGMRRMIPPNVANTIMTTVNLVFSLAILALSTELTDYAIANAVAGVVGLIPFVVVLKRYWGGPYLALPTIARTREIVVYGLKGQVVWIADLVNMETDKIVIAVVLGVKVAGAYEIGSRVATALRSFGILTVSAMIPTATAEIVERGRGIIPKFYHRYMKLSIGLSFGVFALGIVTAPFVLVAWLGEVPGDSDLVVALLTVGFAFNVSTGVSSSLAMAEGKPGLVAFYSTVTAVVNVILTIALTPLFGLWGVLVATVLAWAVGSLLFIRAYNRENDLVWGDYLSAVVPVTALCVACSAPCIAWFLLGGTVPADRLPALAATAVVAITFLVPFWTFASRFGFLPDRLTPGAVMRALRRDARAA